MFDNINFEIKCPRCGELVKDFQSKDGSCMLDTLEYWEVDNFYSQCNGCKLWIEFNRKKKQVDISEYEMETR